LKNPMTGRRRSRPNDSARVIVEEGPELRIVRDELWNGVKARQTATRESEGVAKARATRFWDQRRAQNLLTGLVYCGACGSRMAAVGRDYLACSAARGQGTCPNRKGMRRAPLEEMILNGLRQRLMAPELVEELVAAFHEEVNRHRREETAARAGKERELAEVTRKLEKLIEALIEGYRTAGLQQRLEELEAPKAALEQDLAPTPAARAAAPQPRPGLPGQDRAAARGAGRARTAGPGAGHPARLIERVVVHPGGDGLQVEIVARS
jgi:site-specific DNA recombinase